VKLLPFDTDRVRTMATKMYDFSKGPHEGGQGMSEYIRQKIFMPGSKPPWIDGRLISESLPDSARRNKVDLSDVLAELQKRHYGADNMYLSLLSNLSLDDQTQLVVDTFGSVPRSGGELARNALLDRPKPSNITSDQIRQTGFAIKTGNVLSPPLLELQLMNSLGVTIPWYIEKFMDHCFHQATGPWFLFDEFMRNQSLVSVFVAPGPVQADIDVYGFMFWLSDFGAQNLDLVLNHTFRHINAAKLCLANSSKYEEFASSHWDMINNMVNFVIQRFQ